MQLFKGALAGFVVSMLALTGCGGGSSSSVVTPPPPPPAEFLYATSYAGVLTFSVDSSSGALTLESNGYTASDNFGIAATPSASFLYASDYTAGGVDGFSISKAGVLSPVSGSPFLLPNDPPNSYPGGVDSLAMHPSGKFLYAPDTPVNEVAGFAIDGTTGNLSAVPGSPFPVGVEPTQVIINPLGTFLYVSNFSDGTISGFTIDSSSGALTPITGSPFPTVLGTPDGIVIHPSGKFLFCSLTFGESIAGYSIDSTTGALSALQGSPFPLGTNDFAAPYSIAQDPAGKFLYAAGTSDGKIYEFSVDASRGTLTPLTHSPFDESIALFASSATVDPSGKFLYFSTATSTGVSTLNIDAGTGELSWATPRYVQATSITRGFTVVSVPQQ